jgi:hypothetical protein
MVTPGPPPVRVSRHTPSANFEVGPGPGPGPAFVPLPVIGNTPRASPAHAASGGLELQRPLDSAFLAHGTCH